MMHVDETLWHGTIEGLQAKLPCNLACIVRKVTRKEMASGGRQDLFWTVVESSL